ncbi:MAG TPA: hypothetical protein VGG69_08775 [Rhizomicrobium sp.]
MSKGNVRVRAVLSAVIFAGLACVRAQAAPNFPAGAEANERTLLTAMDGGQKAWIKDQARTMVSSGRVSEDRARTLAQGAHMASHVDVNSTSFLLLMQAARDADADLQATMDRHREEWADQEERSSIAHSRAPTVSQLSPETQTVLSMKAHTTPVMTLRSNDTSPLSPGAAPSADADTSMHLDLQTAMERESAAEEALSSAARRMTLTSAPFAAP